MGRFGCVRDVGNIREESCKRGDIQESTMTVRNGHETDGRRKVSDKARSVAQGKILNEEVWLHKECSQEKSHTGGSRTKEPRSTRKNYLLMYTYRGSLLHIHTRAAITTSPTVPPHLLLKRPRTEVCRMSNNFHPFLSTYA